MAATAADRLLEGRLARLVSGLPGAALAFSGGVDSSYLLSVAVDARGPRRIRAVLGISPSLSSEQRRQAHRVAGLLDVPLEELETREHELPGYRANLGDRCFFCKDTLFGVLRERFRGYVLLDGTNRDDLGGHRPGLRAAQRHGVRSPLAEVGLRKDAIRRLSRERGLPTWDTPASPCLASRFPAGQPVSVEGLRRVESAEAVLREEGFRELRVRDHGRLARIELPASELARLAGTSLGARVAARLKELGYAFVSLDLEGFRSGSGSMPGP